MSCQPYSLLLELAGRVGEALSGLWECVFAAPALGLLRRCGDPWPIFWRASSEVDCVAILVLL